MKLPYSYHQVSVIYFVKDPTHDSSRTSFSGSEGEHKGLVYYSFSLFFPPAHFFLWFQFQNLLKVIPFFMQLIYSSFMKLLHCEFGALLKQDRAYTVIISLLYVFSSYWIKCIVEARLSYFCSFSFHFCFILQLIILKTSSLLFNSFYKTWECKFKKEIPNERYIFCLYLNFITFRFSKLWFWVSFMYTSVVGNNDLDTGHCPKMTPHTPTPSPSAPSPPIRTHSSCPGYRRDCLVKTLNLVLL